MQTKLMQSLFALSIAFLVSSENCDAQISNDALVFTLRVQQGIPLDSMLARAIDSSLSAARAVDDSLGSIHAIPDYVDKELLVSTSAPWSEAWRHGELWTGQPYLDSLATQFGLIEVDTNRYGPLFVLKFRSSLQAARLALLYAKDVDLDYAEPNYYGGDGDDIEFFQKNREDYFVFSIGRGDCQAGCMTRFYWYVAVSRSEPQRKAVLEESRWRSGAVLYRWNIPPRYAMTIFPNVDSILSAVRHASDWWVRRHAIEGIWRFFVMTYPWVGEDLNNTWTLLRNQLLLRRDEVVTELQLARLDSDQDVHASADTALARITVLLVTEPGLSMNFALAQNYPNPFNPSTRIQYQLAHESYVSLKVYNLLGQEVAVLVNTKMTSGEHTATWDASAQSAGVYFYRLRASEFVQSRTMILLK
jgi:hypothetical protein